jgi:transposase InsO family protein
LYRSLLEVGVVERFNQSLKYEYLYRLEIREVLELEAACEDYAFYHDTRPHEAIGFEAPLARYLIEPDWPPRPHLSEPESVQVS